MPWILKGLFKFEMNAATKYAINIIVSMIPVGIVGFFFKDKVEEVFSSGLIIVGWMLLLTAVLLAFSYYAKPRQKEFVSMRDAFIIGLSQACAVMPGLSRSGTTIATGLLLGNKKEKIAQFSFLMVIPPILGEALLDIMKAMPLALDLAHSLLRELAQIRKNENKLMPYLRPDAKSQVTIEYADNGKPLRIDTIVISTQHDEFILPKGITQEEADEAMQKRIAEDVKSILVPRVKAQYPSYVQELFSGDIKYYVNPTGKFVIGGPHGDTGLTGRKIIVDTYGGKGAHVYYI